MNNINIWICVFILKISIWKNMYSYIPEINLSTIFNWSHIYWRALWYKIKLRLTLFNFSLNKFKRVMFSILMMVYGILFIRNYSFYSIYFCVHIDSRIYWVFLNYYLGASWHHFKYKISNIPPIFFIVYFCMPQDKHSYKLGTSWLSVGIPRKDFPPMTFLRLEFSHSWMVGTGKIKSGEVVVNILLTFTVRNSKEELICSNRLGIGVIKAISLYINLYPS